MNFEPENLLKHFPALYMIGDGFPYMMEPFKTDLHNQQLFVYDFGCRLAYRLISRRCDPVMAVGNKFIPDACPFFYYEVYLEDMGSGGHIQIGFVGENVTRKSLLSKEQSIGVYADDKRVSFPHDTTNMFPVVCCNMDTIGVGINFVEKSFFYTRNGELKSIAPLNLEKMSLRPAISLSSPGSQLVVNLGNRPYTFLLDKLIKPIYESFIKKLKKPTGCSNGTGATETLNVIFQYMNHHCFTNTAKEIVKYVDNAEKYKYEDFDFSREIYELIRKKDFIQVFEKIIDIYPELNVDCPSVYLALLCGKYYQIAYNLCQKQSHEQDDESYTDNDLWQLISISRDILESFRDYDTEYSKIGELTDSCGMMKSEWQSFIKELLSLMCYNELEYFTRFDYLYDFRAKMWNGISKLLNRDDMSILESLPSIIINNFEKKMLVGDTSAAIGLSYAIYLLEGKDGFKFT